MPVFLLPQFIVDLQKHKGANFAKRVLQKTIRRDGGFLDSSNDHRYNDNGIKHAWIRYVSGKRTAYRVIYFRKGENVYLYRAGEHSVEDQLTAPAARTKNSALQVNESKLNFATVGRAVSTQESSAANLAPVSRFKYNDPTPQIYRAIFSRRNLPHKDIWIVAPFVDRDLFVPTAHFGKLLLDQVEDGANVVLITAAPKDKNIKWMENLNERNVEIFVHPRLHSKLYCFVFDENRRYVQGMPDRIHDSSLILVGSANLTAAGMAIGIQHYNEELCYAVSEKEIGFVESYVLKLMENGYDMPEVRKYLARGRWQILENSKW